MPSPTLFFRADRSTRAAVEAAAKAANTTLSGWLRESARMRLPDGGASLPPLSSSRPRRPIRIPPEDVAAVARLTGHAGKLTGATIQLARCLRETGRILENETTEAVLRDLRSTQADLVNIVDRLRAAEAMK
jgi:hypothetical protein